MIALDVAYGELDYRLRADERVTVIERANARAITPDELPYRPDLVVIDVSFISLHKVLPAVLASTADGFDCLAMVKPQFEVGRERIGKGGVVRDPALRREVVNDVAAAARERAPRCMGSAPSALAGPVGQQGDLPVARRGRAAPARSTRSRHGERRRGDHPPPARRDDGRGPHADRGRPRAPRHAALHARTRPPSTGSSSAPFIEIVPELGDDVDLCIVLGGDGTILTALRRYAGTGVPVFAVNYGEVGFLATIDPNGLAEDFARAFAGEFDTIELPTISVGRPDGTWSALNDISVHRKAGLRVADLAYALAGEEIGRVRCDGLVIATPQGSTGYNLANGGPVLAWGVEGYVVSFIAPHSLTARALVVAPGDELTINNASREEAVEVHVDGRPTLELPPGEDIHIAFGLSHGTLAQLPGASFYHRLRERFGRLAR